MKSVSVHALLDGGHRSHYPDPYGPLISDSSAPSLSGENKDNHRVKAHTLSATLIGNGIKVVGITRQFLPLSPTSLAPNLPLKVTSSITRRIQTLSLASLAPHSPHSYCSPSFPHSQSPPHPPHHRRRRILRFPRAVCIASR